MPKQAAVPTGRRNKNGRPRGGSRGRGGSTAGRSQSVISATPESAAGATGLKLKINLNGTNTHVRESATPQPTADYFVGAADEGEEVPDQVEVDQELPVAAVDEGVAFTENVAPFSAEAFSTEGQFGRTTRAGRQTKPPKYFEDSYGNSDAIQPGATGVGKVDDGSEEEYQDTTVTRKVFERQEPRRKPGRPRKNANAPSLLTRRNGEPSSGTISPPGRYSPAPWLQPDNSTLKIDARTYEILDHLTAKPRVPIDLPELENYNDPEAVQPYSAQFLTELYLAAYTAGQWNICDLVADTWIRMWHALRRRAEKSGTEDSQLWRVNNPLKRQRMQGKGGFNPDPPTYGRKLAVADPTLSDSAHSFDRKLLSDLYTHTRPGCGARLLWADCMALCGSKIEHQMARDKKHGETWHPDLMYDMLCTTLRMLRRKLTLKIEESTEGVWCERYHEHGKYGLPCYRKLAAEEIEQEEKVGRSRKRARQSIEGEADEENQVKRARYAHDQRELVGVDEDAEGESEYE